MGERGQNAYIPRLLGLDVESDTTPFAELWIGTHPAAPDDEAYVTKREKNNGKLRRGEIFPEVGGESQCRRGRGGRKRRAHP